MSSLSPLRREGWSTSSDSGDDAAQGDGLINVASPTSSPRPADVSGLSTPSEETQHPPTMALPSARAYQLEMLEESLKQNVIVAVSRSDLHLPPWVLLFTRRNTHTYTPPRWTPEAAKPECRRRLSSLLIPSMR